MKHWLHCLSCQGFKLCTGGKTVADPIPTKQRQLLIKRFPIWTSHNFKDLELHQECIRLFPRTPATPLAINHLQSMFKWWLMFPTCIVVVFLTALAMERGLIAPLKLFELQRNKHKRLERSILRKKENLTWSSIDREQDSYIESEPWVTPSNNTTLLPQFHASLWSAVSRKNRTLRP